MSALDRILDLLPPPYSVAPDSVLAQLLDAIAVQIDAAQEDIDRVRRTHWIYQAYRFEDVRRLGALFDIAPLAWEDLASYRVRLLALVEARIAGALGPNEIKGFVEDYLRGAEEALETLLIPALADVRDPWAPSPTRAHFRPLELAEYPPRRRISTSLAARDGLVPVLHRWSEANRGLDEAVPTFRITGLSGGRTAVPVLANLTTGDMLLYADRIGAGTTVEITAAGGDDPRAARATVAGHDVTHRLRSMAGLVLGQPFAPDDFDEAPRLPPLPRGDNEWLFLSVGLYDVRGLDRFFFALADADLREGRYDETRFDHALFPSGAIARLEMGWTETEAAAFEVRVPRTLVVAPAGSATPPHELVADALGRSLFSLHAAGVRATLRFMPFADEQPQTMRATLPWIRLDREYGPAGTRDELAIGMHFGETGLGRARFE